MGHLAEGSVARGKMPEPSVLYRMAEYMIGCNKDLAGKKILITAGPTREPLDPVRYLTNRSTGKMGYALAKAAAMRGAETVLVSGPVHDAGDGVDNALLTGGGGNASDSVMLPAGVKRVPVQTAAEMAEAVKKESRDADCVIMAAAVADFRPLRQEPEKIKKAKLKQETDPETGVRGYSLSLERTEDILAWLGAHRQPGQKLAGFSMETENLLENSRRKLVEKQVDLIAANSLKKAGAGFGTDTNIVTLIRQEGERELPLLSKEETAQEILNELFAETE